MEKHGIEVKQHAEYMLPLRKKNRKGKFLTIIGLDFILKNNSDKDEVEKIVKEIRRLQKEKEKKKNGTISK